jgi:hypothetical protein
VQILPGVSVTGASYPIDVRPDTVKFTFNTDVGATLAPSDLVLTRTDGGTVPAVQSFQWDSGTRTATFFLTPGNPPSATYRATLPAYAVNSTGGQPLNADYTFQFIFLLGDATKDGVVNSADFNALALHFNQAGQNWSAGDFNYDGTVNGLDFNALASSFGAVASPAPGATRNRQHKARSFTAGARLRHLPQQILPELFSPTRQSPRPTLLPICSPFNESSCSRFSPASRRCSSQPRLHVPPNTSGACSSIRPAHSPIVPRRARFCGFRLTANKSAPSSSASTICSRKIFSITRFSEKR